MAGLNRHTQMHDTGELKYRELTGVAYRTSGAPEEQRNVVEAMPTIDQQLIAVDSLAREIDRLGWVLKNRLERVSARAANTMVDKGAATAEPDMGPISPKEHVVDMLATINSRLHLSVDLLRTMIDRLEL